MFEAFHAHFTADATATPYGGPWRAAQLSSARGGVALADLAGASFNSGLYRVHDSSTGHIGQAAVSVAFPTRGVESTVFAFDWLGRQFALDPRRTRGGDPLVLMFDLGAGEALELPVTLLEFHDAELIEYHDAALASDFFSVFSSSHPEAIPLAHSRCAGYRVPLFLGGNDDVTNIEVTDLDVYWALTAQLVAQTRGLPPGAAIGEVTS